LLSADRCYRNEQHCDNGWCLLTKTQCVTGSYSYRCPSRGSFWCDGYYDCPDQSDETNCNATISVPDASKCFATKLQSTLDS